MTTANGRPAAGMERELLKLYSAAKRVTDRLKVEMQTENGYAWTRAEFPWAGTRYVWSNQDGDNPGFLADMVMLKAFVQHVEQRFPELVGEVGVEQ